MEWLSKIRKSGFAIKVALAFFLVAALMGFSGCSDITGPSQPSQDNASPSQPSSASYVAPVDTTATPVDSAHSTIEKVGTVTVSVTFQVNVAKH